jgi:PAS domain S-box-containing protein
MHSDGAESIEQRVLALMSGPEAEASRVVLDEGGFEYRFCRDLADLLRELAARGGAVVLLTEDVIASPDLPNFTETLRYQPSWSDLPIVLLSHAGAEAPDAARAIALLGNVAVLERPVRGAALVSALRTALRARQRQYALRDQLESLRQSEERFELAAQATHDALWDLDCTVGAGGHRKLNRSVFGFGAAGHDSGIDVWTDRVHPADRDRVVASLLAALDGTESLWTAEYRFRLSTGAFVDIFDRGQIIRDARGRAVRAVGAMTDISARKQAEEMGALHAAIVMSSDDAIVSKTLDGTIRSWNAGAERLFGYSAVDAIGRPITLIVPPHKLAEEASILERLSRGERIQHFETVRVAKDGREIGVSLTVSPLTDANGRVFGASKVARDVTARKRAEAELRRQEAQLSLLWESASVLLTTDRPDTMLRGVFAKIAPYFRLDAYLNFMVIEGSDALELESWSGIRQEDVELLRRLDLERDLSGAVARQRKPISADHLQQAADDAAHTERRLGFRAYAGYPLIADGRLLGVLAFATRIKEELSPDELEFLETVCRYVTAAYERVSLIRRLRDTDHRKDEFLATLAHELRNPLAPIRNALEIMRVNGRDRSAVEQAARMMIERQLEQMVRLVDDLLDVSRITRGRLEMRKEQTELAAVIKSAVETSRPLIDAAGHDLTVTLPAQPVYIEADPVRLAQVFANLLNNAARYMDRGGRITVSAEREGGQIVVRVRDTGMGIPPEALPRIFDMFAQVDETRERSQTGLGIGLTLVKRIVDLHGGTVEAHSEGPGRGTELVVRLPGTMAAPAARTPVIPGVTQPHSVARRILVADDNRDAAESMGMLLRLMGNEVRTVYDGAEAVEAAAAFRPDVILLDIGMPKLNGYDVARRIREQQWSEGTMLIALTGWGQDEDKRRASEAGFDRHFTKPLDPAELQRVITDFHVV